MNNNFADRIDSLRELMTENGWDAVVVSGSDPHSSEYPAPRWQQVKWLSGFTGEAGDLVVTHDHAGLWTDSRYFIQALEQLEGTGVELHKTRVPGAVGIPEWLSDRAHVVAFDGLCQSAGAAEEFSGQVIDVPDMLETLWEDRPSIPVSPVTTLDVDCFGGIPRLQKIEWLRKWMLLHGVDRVLLSSLDEIDPSVLKDKMICDRLCSNSSGKLPDVLKVKNPEIKKIRLTIEDEEVNRRKPGIKRGFALLESENAAVFIDYEDKDPVTGKYMLKKVYYESC